MPQDDDDLLLRIKTQAQALRDKRYEIKNIEERLEAAKADVRTLQREVIPDLMAQAGIPSLTIEAEGNTPAYEIKMRPFARASIAAAWEPNRREAAFDWLDTHGAGDLIKTEIAILLPKEKRAEALELIQRLRTMNYEPQISESVHHGTLSKWLKEAIRQGHIVPLDVIGGEVGREVTIKESDDGNN